MYAKDVLLQQSAKNLTLQKKLGDATLLTSLHNNKSRSILGSDDESQEEKRNSLHDIERVRAATKDAVAENHPKKESFSNQLAKAESLQEHQQSEVMESGSHSKPRVFPNYPKTKKTGKPYGQIKFSRFLLPETGEGSKAQFEKVSGKKSHLQRMPFKVQPQEVKSRVLPSVALSKYDILKDNQKVFSAKSTASYYLGSPTPAQPGAWSGGAKMHTNSELGTMIDSSRKIRIVRRRPNRGQAYESEITALHSSVQKNYELITNHNLDLLRETPDARFEKLARLERVKFSSAADLEAVFTDGQLEPASTSDAWTSAAARGYKKYLRGGFSNSLAMPAHTLSTNPQWLAINHAQPAQQFYQSEVKELPVLQRLPSSCFASVASLQPLRGVRSEKILTKQPGLLQTGSFATGGNWRGLKPAVAGQGSTGSTDARSFFSSIKSTPYLLC